MTDLLASNYRTLTFDCYGTLIDWESGILEYLQPVRMQSRSRIGVRCYSFLQLHLATRYAWTWNLYQPVYKYRVVGTIPYRLP